MLLIYQHLILLKSIYDLANYKGSANGWQYDERVLFCVPLRDAAPHLPMFSLI